MGKSKGGKSKGGKSVKTEVEYVVPQAPPLVTAPLQGTNPAELPFKEWSDQDVNSEKWTADSKKGKKEPEEGPKLFEDPQVVHLPISLVAHAWKRPAEVYPEAQFVIFDEKPVYPDLISGSKHLLQSEFVRSFISSVATLMYLGNTRQFTSVEFTTPTYVPNTADDPWRPWHHVYSNCKLGKGKDHAPVVNGIGKYIVRLFWLGAWRKIYVDDLLPVDMLNHVLLPSLELTKEEQEKLMPQEETPPPTPATVDSGKKSKASDKKKPPPPKVIEVWPFLLSKALLKIASLSWYDDRELLDFDIVQCLTGWVPQKIDTKDLTIDDIWELCSAYTDHFCWPPDKSEASKSTKSTKGSKKGKKGKAALDDLDSAANAHHLMARCDDMRNFAEDEILDVSPCWGHYFLIDQTRNIPLIKPTLTADLPFWKRFRWLSWAVEKGLISPEENMDQIRCFKFVSLFKKVYEHVVYKQPSKMAIEIEETVNAIEDLVKDKKGKEKGGKGKGKDKKSDKSSKSSKSSKAKSSKSSKGSKKKKFDPSLIPNPSIWLDYEKLAHQITTLTIYFKPSKFKSKIKITDLTPAAAGGKGGKGGGSPRKGKGGDPSAEWQTFISPRIIKVSRNEPVYVFTDSVDYKLLVLSLLQTGYTQIFDKTADTSDHPESTGITECEFCVAALVKRIRRNITKSDRRTFITLTPDEPEPVDHERPRAHFVLETFDWRKETLGDMVTSLCTFANKTTVVDLCPGRHVFKLWVKSDTPYVLYLLSDTSVVSGTLEAVLFSLSQESQLLMNACIEVASNFGKLVQSFGMPEFPLQLRAFYSSYKPSCFLTKPESNTVHDTFYSLLYDLVKQNASQNELNALKILFFKWQIPRDVINLVGPMCFCNCYDDEEDFEYVKVMQRYVVRVQYFFIGIYERAMMKYHKPEHKNYMKTFDALKNIYNQFFSTDKRLKICPTLFRNFLAHPTMAEIRKKYRLNDDLENVITLKEVINTVSVPENDWTFICRQLFFVNSPDPVLVKINLFCDVNSYIVRVIDNDTKIELKRYTNNVTVNEYSCNVNGYTVLCYGWSDVAKEIRCKLTFAIKKEINENKLIVPPLTTQVDVITGNYIPNFNNYICRYFVQVPSDKVLLTVRFWTSYEEVLVNLRLLDDYGVLIEEVTGKKNIVMPAVVLEFYEKEKPKIASEVSLSLKRSSAGSRSMKSIDKVSKGSGRRSSKSLAGSRKSSKSKRSSEEAVKSSSGLSKSVSEVIEEECLDTIYLIEAVVLDDSWPLRMDEWRAIDILKEEMLYRSTLRESTSTGKKSYQSGVKYSQYSNSEYAVEPPYWVMQVIYNSDDSVQFSKDTRREREIVKMKKKWYKMDSLRYDISQDLRLLYLLDTRIINENLPGDIAILRSLDPNVFAGEILPPYDISEFMTGRRPPPALTDENLYGEGSSEFNNADDWEKTNEDESLEAGKSSSGESSDALWEEEKRNPSVIDTNFLEQLGEEDGCQICVVETKISHDDARRLKTNEDFENDILDEQRILDEFAVKHDNMVEEMNNFVAEQTVNFEQLEDWFNECREDTAIIMEYALSLKAEYIQNVLDAIEKAKPKEEKAEKKKDKKDKGKKKK